MWCDFSPPFPAGPSPSVGATREYRRGTHTPVAPPHRQCNTSSASHQTKPAVMMARGTVTLLALAVLTVVAGNTCTLHPITWSCPAAPHPTLVFPQVTVNKCGETYNKDLFKDLPNISYSGDIDQSKTYTVVMVDPDAPGHTNQQAWLHWIRAGLTGKDLVDGTMNSGQDIMAYTPPTPPPHTGTHRYFVFVFEGTAQGEAQEVNTRAKFNLSEYAKGHHLCGPLASNMFSTQH